MRGGKGYSVPQPGGLKGGAERPPGTGSRIERPGEGTLRGGTPPDQRSRRQHDPAEAEHGSPFPHRPSTKHASSQLLLPRFIAAPSEKRAAAPILIAPLHEHVCSCIGTTSRQHEPPPIPSLRAGRTSCPARLRPAPPPQVHPRPTATRAAAPASPSTAMALEVGGCRRRRSSARRRRPSPRLRVGVGVGVGGQVRRFALAFPGGDSSRTPQGGARPRLAAGGCLQQAARRGHRLVGRLRKRATALRALRPCQVRGLGLRLSVTAAPRSLDAFRQHTRPCVPAPDMGSPRRQRSQHGTLSG